MFRYLLILLLLFIIIIIIINVHLETLYIVQLYHSNLQKKNKVTQTYIYIHSSVPLLNYNYVWGERCVFNNFLKISNELADLISVGSFVPCLS